jgi:hypothetical protein
MTGSVAIATVAPKLMLVPGRTPAQVVELVTTLPTLSPTWYSSRCPYQGAAHHGWWLGSGTADCRGTVSIPAPAMAYNGWGLKQSGGCHCMTAWARRHASNSITTASAQHVQGTETTACAGHREQPCFCARDCCWLPTYSKSACVHEAATLTGVLVLPLRQAPKHATPC